MKRRLKITLIIFIFTFIILLVSIGAWYYYIQKSVVSEDDFMEGKTPGSVIDTLTGSTSDNSTDDGGEGSSAIDEITKQLEISAQEAKLKTLHLPEDIDSEDHDFRNGFYYIENKYGCPDDPLCSKYLTYQKDDYNQGYRVHIKSPRTHWRIEAVPDEPHTYLMKEQSSCPDNEALCHAQIGVAGMPVPEIPSYIAHGQLTSELRALESDLNGYKAERDQYTKDGLTVQAAAKDKLAEEAKEEIREIKEKLENTVYQYNAGLKKFNVPNPGPGMEGSKFIKKKVKLLKQPDNTIGIELVDLPGYYLAPSRFGNEDMANRAYGKFSKNLPYEWKFIEFVPSTS